jgi:hypothetical protein
VESQRLRAGDFAAQPFTFYERYERFCSGIFGQPGGANRCPVMFVGTVCDYLDGCN